MSLKEQTEKRSSDWSLNDRQNRKTFEQIKFSQDTKKNCVCLDDLSDRTGHTTKTCKSQSCFGNTLRRIIFSLNPIQSFQAKVNILLFR